ncbi:pyridoxal phosphate-dependent aminotransferase [Acetobacter thailandicus]|uniref:pyridoxal phosphate-dependent aminotransferase n=1 Tax=Acetobacter thailandicus TaxID=1502842 RepID=UPI0038CFCAF6
MPAISTVSGTVETMSIVADRLNRISPSQTVVISAKARALKASGRDIISLSAGEPDFRTPDNIGKAAARAIENGQTQYTDVAGTPELRKAVAERFRLDSGLDYTADEILVSTGGKQIIYNAMMASLNPGDETVIPAPCWVSYPDIVTLAEGVPVIVHCKRENGFKLTADELRAAITPRTKWLFLNSPCNPTGASYSAEELRPLCDVLLEHPHVWVFTDDIYAKLVYDGFKPATFVEVEPRLRSRTVTMNGVSKAYAMTGWRIGFSGAPVELTKAMNKLQGQSTGNTCSIAQAAAVEALQGPQDFIADMVKIYEERRNFVVSRINQCNGLECDMPSGAFYVFPSVEKCLGKTSRSGVVLKTDEDFVTALLEEEGVAAVHGSAFMYTGYMRLSYATDTESLRKACERIENFCNGLR